VISMILSRPFQDLLIATVNLKMTRLMLLELVRLAAQAPRLTDEQLRFRLLALAAYAARSPVPSRSPAGRWLSEAPRVGSRRPAGTTQHHRECAVRGQRAAADLWPHLVQILPGKAPGNEC
jgi:hypothetical protein